MNLRSLELTIVTEPGRNVPALVSRRPQALVTYEASAYLTPAHVDVTTRVARYARPKNFGFPTKRQLQAMDADRWVRQRMKAANHVAVSDLPAIHFSLDYRDRLHRSVGVERSAGEFIHDMLLRASQRFLTGGKVAR
jgi:hypothetical protein